jgi:hypothetical protein
LVFRLLLFILASHSWLLAPAQGVGPDSSYALVYDFRDDWQVYDPAYQAHVPYGRERHARYGAFSVFLDLTRFRPYQLLYRSEAETYLFVNAALQQKLPLGTWAVLSVDSLYRAHRSPRVLLTFYGSAPTPASIRLLVGYPIPRGQTAPAVSESLLQARPRTLTAFESFLALATLLIGVYGAFLFNAYHRTFTRYFSLRDLLTINPRDASVTAGRGLFELNNLLMVVCLSLVLAYVYMLVQHRNIDLFSTQRLLSRGQTVGELFLNFLGAALLIFVLYVAKYAILVVLGSLYRFERMVDIHFFKLVQATLLFFSGLALVLIVLTMSFPASLSRTGGYLVAPVILFFLLRLVLLYFTINKLSATKNLYLFSYLCIVELIPLVVGVRFAL